MQTAPNWQAIAKNYCFVVSNRADVTSQMHVNINNEPSQVHFQREGVVSYYKKLMVRALRQNDHLPRLHAHQMDTIRKMAEAQFGQILIGIV